MIQHDALQFTVCEWHRRLDAFFLSHARRPFQWGVNDCCLFAADAVLVMTGVDHAAGFRGTYSTSSEATDVLARLGGLESLAARAGPECLPLCARLGDVGIVNDGKGDLLAICVSDMWAVPGTRGMAVLPFNAALRAWRVHAVNDLELQPEHFGGDA